MSSSTKNSEGRGSVHDAPLVSIVVNNYNYAQFVGQAIESALGQTYAHKEIIVVDDGSTDRSRTVIEEFTEQVNAVFKENEGQASTFNAGFKQSRGDIVVYLDADDLLMPEAVEKAVASFDSERVVKVHWPLWEMDAAGNNLGKIHRDSLIDGDYRDEFIRRGPIALPQSPTSGNAWARWFLEHVMPLPEHEDKHGADGYLKKLCPIYGEIRRIDKPQGYYRIHSGNHGGGQSSMFKLRRGLNRYPTYCRLLAEHLGRQGVSVDPARWTGPDSQYAWLKNCVAASADVDAVIPEGEPLVLIDNGELGADILPRHQVLPFPQQEGEFGGPLSDDQHGIQELERRRNGGVRWAVLAFTAFWWQNEYPGFFEHLHSRSNCVLENDRVQVFALAADRPSDAGHRSEVEFETAEVGNSPTSTVHVSDAAHDEASETNAARPCLSNGRYLADFCREVFGSAPEKFQPLGQFSNDCRAFKLRLKHQKIKCYECQSPEHARLTEQATRALLAARVPIPRILAVSEHVVFAEWISGKPLNGSDRSTCRRMATYQAQLHRAAGVSLSDARSRQFMHLDWLLKRLANSSRNHVCPDRVQVLSQTLCQRVPPGLKPGVVQPDFIKSNLIATNAGELVIVDNELLGVGLGFEFDILNTSHAVSGGDETKQRHYLDAYRQVGDLGTLETHAAFWNLCYLAKLAGKRFLMNDVTMGKVCLELLEMKLREYVQVGS